jgi:hypothetical protein
MGADSLRRLRRNRSLGFRRHGQVSGLAHATYLMKESFYDPKIAQTELRTVTDPSGLLNSVRPERIASSQL